MRRGAASQCLLSGLSALVIALTATGAESVEFAIVGPRATGMGGAGVAITDDALATYWNPAGLAMKKTVDIRAQGTGQVVDRLGVGDTINEVNNINRDDISLANQTRLQSLLDKLARPGTSVSAIGAGGFYIKGYFGNHAFGFNVSDVATGGAFFSTVDRNVTVSGGKLQNNTQLSMRALEARQAAFSYAYARADKTFAIGVTGKLIQGAAYSAQTNIFNSDGDVGFAGDLGKAKLSTAFGVDVGAIYRPASWIRIGVVGKDLNQPTFDTPDGGEFKLTPQARGGIAVNPYSSLTITFDGDLTSNKTLIPGIKSRMLSLGAEQTLFSEVLALRVGALKNVADANSFITPTAGLGLRLFFLRLDVGAGYDFRERGALGSVSLAMTF